MKKVLMVLVVGLGVLISGVALGYTTYKEAYDAGTLKRSKGDYVGSILDFNESLTFASIDTEKSITYHSIGHSYFNLGDYTNAKLEYNKVINIPNNPSYLVDAQLFKAHCYYNEKDYVNAKIEYIKTLTVIKELSGQQAAAFNRLIELGIDWQTFITGMGTPVNYVDFYYRAKAKEQLKDWQGALNDYYEAFRLRPEDKSADKQILEALKAVEALLK